MNSNIIDNFEKLIVYEKLTGDNRSQYKIKHFNKVLKLLKNNDTNGFVYEDYENLLLTIFKKPTKILIKIQEIMDTGTLEILKNANQDNLNMTNMKSISKIHGIGKVKVKKLSELGIKNVQHLYAYDKQYNILNNIQKIGLKYHEDLEKRIPREEMREYEKIFKLIGSHINVITKIVGSYRRGALTSGDIDILVSDKDKKYQNHDKNVIDIILNILQKSLE